MTQSEISSPIVVEQNHKGGTLAGSETSRKVVPHRDTLWLSGADGLNLLFGIVIHVILTRALLSDDYGLFVLLLDFFHVCVILVDLGLPTLISRDGGRLGNRLPNLLNKIVRLQFVIVLVIAILGMLAVGMVNSGWVNPALLLAFSAGLQVLAYSFRSAFRALGEARLEAIVRVVDRSVVALLMATWATSIPTLAAATAMGPAIALLFASVTWKYRIEPRLNNIDGDTPKIGEMETVQLVKTGLPFLVAGAALVINVRIEKLLLGVLANPEDVAVYQIAWLGFIAGYAPILSLRAVLLSWFGEVRDDAEKFWHRYEKALYTSLILAPVGMGIGFFIGPFVFSELFPNFVDEVLKPFNALLFVWLLHTMASPSLALIQAGDKPWNYTRILWVGIVISFCFAIYLIPTQPNPVIAACAAAAAGALSVFALAITGVKTGWAGNIQT